MSLSSNAKDQNARFSFGPLTSGWAGSVHLFAYVLATLYFGHGEDTGT